MHSNATSQIKHECRQPSQAQQLFTCLPIRPNRSFTNHSYSNVHERRLLCYVSLSIQIMFPCFPVPRFQSPRDWVTEWVSESRLAHHKSFSGQSLLAITCIDTTDNHWRPNLPGGCCICLEQSAGVSTGIDVTASFSQQTEHRAFCPVVQLLWLRASHCTDYHVTSLLFLRVTCPCSLRTYTTLKLIRSSSTKKKQQESKQTHAKKRKLQ